MPKRVLVRTLPVGRNYGGVLQAYALQRAISDLGHSVVTDVSQRTVVRSPARRFAGRARDLIFPRRRRERAMDVSIHSPLQDFVRNRMDTVRLFGTDSRTPKLDWRTYDTILVGSDQVWRPAYADVSSYLLDFVAQDEEVRRVAYAASFGTDTLEGYDMALLQRSAVLARQFDVISVREHSAVGLAQTHWDVAAVQMPDPTFLLDAYHYQELAADTSPSSRFAAVYLLDPDASKSRVAREITSDLGLDQVNLLPAQPVSWREFARAPDRHRMLGVETWLGTLLQSDYVVTDSFHGVVFSLLFNKPFVAFGNKSRGQARFTSVLADFGLTELMVDPNEAGKLGRLPSLSVDWARVNRIRLREQRRGFDFLMATL